MIEVLINVALTMISVPFLLVLFISSYYLLLYVVEMLTERGKK